MISNFIFLSRSHKLTYLGRQNFIATVLNPSPLCVVLNICRVFFFFCFTFLAHGMQILYVAEKRGKKHLPMQAAYTYIHVIIMIILFLLFTIFILFSYYGIFHSLVVCFSAPNLNSQLSQNICLIHLTFWAYPLVLKLVL